MKPVEPIFVTDLFAEVHGELLTLLKNLCEEDWDKPTAAGAWTVRDLVAHLLDTDIRRLSHQRDRISQVPPDSPIETYRDLVGFLNQLNADWIKAAKRISPKLLVEFLTITGPQVADFFRTLDPFAHAIFGVAWAGEENSPNWFDIAREYTEKWHHQQQIRDAVGVSAITSRKWLFPVLDTFFRGLPHTFRETFADDKTEIGFAVTGEAGGDWTLARQDGVWRLYSGASNSPQCQVSMDQDTAWRLLTKGLSKDQAASRITFAGEAILGQPILGMLSVIA